MDQGAKAFIKPLYYALAALSLAALSLLSIPASPATADTQLPTIINEDMTWTEAGSPYLGYGSGVTIASQATVTVEPGVLVKIAQEGNIHVDGTLNVQGTEGNKVTFTSLEDSISHRWGGVNFREGSSGSIDYAQFRYGGNDYAGVNAMINSVEDVSVTNSSFTSSLKAGVRVDAGSPTISGSTFFNNRYGVYVQSPGDPLISDNTIEQSWNFGILYQGSPLMVSGGIRVKDNSIRESTMNGLYMVLNDGFGFSGGDVSGNTFEDNGTNALHFEGSVFTADAPLPQNINQNSATGNGCDCVFVNHATSVAEATTWQPGLPIVIGGDIEVLAPLAIAGGTVIKGRDDEASRISVTLGSLDVQGSKSNPVTFTSFHDDTYGGDTDNNGQSTPGAGQWGGITVYGTGQATFEGANLRYGGAYSGYGTDYGMVTVHGPPMGAATTIKHSTIAHSDYGGIYVSEYVGALPIIERNSFYGNVNFAIFKQASQVLTAPNNQWGCDSGPRPVGCGDQINEYVNPPPFDQPEIPDGQCVGSKDQCGKGSDPVSMATGAFTHSHEDLSLTGTGPTLNITRSYNSKDPTDAGLGPGWSYPGLLTASEDEIGDVTVRRADGRRDIYTYTDPGYDPPSGVHDTLIKNPDATFTLTTPDQTTYDFDQTGRIALITDDHGQALTYGYDTNGRLASITDSSNQSITFSYNSSNHITGVSDSTGRTVSYTYDAEGNLATVTDPLGNTATYTYDSADRLVSIKDPEGTTFITNTYDSEGRVTSQEDALGNVWTINYQEGKTQVTDPEGGVETFAFDEVLRVISQTDQSVAETTNHYDADGNIDLITRPGSAEYSYAYDSSGNLVSESHPENGTRTYTYDPQNHLTAYTDARDNSWAFTWSESNDLTEVKDPKDNSTSLTYNSQGLPLTITDPEDHTTTLDYDSRGNLTSSTNPLNNETTYTYDSRNYLTSQTEPGKDPTTLTRNSLGDLLSTTDPEDSTTTFTYNKNGELKTLTDPGDNTWEIKRNAADRPTEIVDPKLNQTEISYDKNLNPISITDRRGNSTAYTYDLSHRITKITRPEGGSHSVAYDARGNISSITDPRGKLSSYSYDLADRLTLTQEPQLITTSYTYDAEDNLTSTTDPRGYTTSYAYDSLNLPTDINQPLGKETSYTYDKAQNLKTLTTAAGTRTYAYDAADQLTSIKEGDQNLRSYTYDPVGRVDTATNSQGTTVSINYDQADRPTEISDGLDQAVEKGYDPSGNLTSQTDARGTQTFEYDQLNRMVSLTDPESQTSSFTYDQEGNLTNSTLPNGVITQNTFNKDNRTTRTTSKKGSVTLQDFLYRYDSAGNIILKKGPGTYSTNYTYDGLSRLLSEKKQPLSATKPKSIDKIAFSYTTYAYDKAGNRTKAGLTKYRYNALNELVRDSKAANYTYDQSGRLTNKTKLDKTTTYSYDLFDQLTSVEDNIQGTTTYTHDAFGRRSSRTAEDSEETAHYGDLTDIPIFDTSVGGEVARSYIEGPEGLIEERSQSETTYPLSDAHGDITTVTDQSGQLTSSHSYSPWGEDLSSIKLKMGYLGAYLRRTDTDTGLTQMGVRQYAPNLGRFTSEDPVLGVYGFGQSLNRHAYAIDNPLRFLDLDGQSIFDTTFWNEWVAPVGGTVKSMASPWTGEVFEDYEMGIRSMPRSLQKFDKAILKYGPLMLPMPGSTVTRIVARGSLGKFVFRVNRGKPELIYPKPVKGYPTRPPPGQTRLDWLREQNKLNTIKYGSKETQRKRSTAEVFREIFRQLGKFEN